MVALYGGMLDAPHLVHAPWHPQSRRQSMIWRHGASAAVALRGRIRRWRHRAEAARRRPGWLPFAPPPRSAERLPTGLGWAGRPRFRRRDPRRDRDRVQTARRSAWDHGSGAGPHRAVRGRPAPDDHRGWIRDRNDEPRRVGLVRQVARASRWPAWSGNGTISSAPITRRKLIRTTGSGSCSERRGFSKAS